VGLAPPQISREASFGLAKEQLLWARQLEHKISSQAETGALFADLWRSGAHVLSGVIAMNLVANATLPNVKTCPQFVMCAAIGRCLQSLYANLLQEALPEKLGRLVKALDRG
jgi:hypothetical protein